MPESELRTLAARIDDLRIYYHSDGDFVRAKWCRDFLKRLRTVEYTEKEAEK